MKRYRTILILLAVGVVAGVAAYTMSAPDKDAAPELSAVIIPELSAKAIEGKAAFDANCMACHGENATGVDGAGPPLVHIIYETSHHGDASFYLAVQNGVRAHHWSFGNMPAIQGVSQPEVAAIVEYVRTLQRANGIF